MQQDPLLRVHAPRFARGDPEELVVERGGGGDEVARMRFECAGGLGVGGAGVVGYFETACWDLYRIQLNFGGLGGVRGR